VVGLLKYLFCGIYRSFGNSLRRYGRVAEPGFALLRKLRIFSAMSLRKSPLLPVVLRKDRA